ncbi:hypothetical protein [Streptomyces sp. NPDC058426]|uniref:hypothetical protein n=1 Tax=Streptomyces sp. NPDC058426 TaxID=3346493 RepID=UPI0036481162
MGALLVACLVAWAAGSSSERVRLGISPAQRDLMREQTRHEKAVQRIATRHGEPGAKAAAPAALVKDPATGAPAAAPAAVPVAAGFPDSFRASWRSHTPVERVATVAGRRAGLWAAQGVAWTKDSGRGALREFRRRRRAAGHPDPAPVLVPMPPAEAPRVPKMPGHAPAGPDREPGGVSLKHPDRETAAPHDGDGKASEGTLEPPASRQGTPGAAAVREAPQGPVEPLVTVPAPRAGDEPADAVPTAKSTGAGAVAPGTAEARAAQTEPVTDTAAPVTDTGTPVTPSVTEAGTPDTDGPAPTTADVTGAATPVTDTSSDDESRVGGEEGVGRMASEVSYDSVMEESDELSLMCEEDTQVYDRIRKRCEREIGRGDTLIAQLTEAGAGQKVIARVTACKERYSAIQSHLDELQRNTLAQGESVGKAKALLEAGQGVYADEAENMESVAEREFYVSDTVDSEDTNAAAEIYEIRGA